MSEPYLRMVNIKKSFPGVQALKEVSFDAYQGEVLALIGSNGAGKSTLMNILGGNMQADEGEIIIGGNVVKITSPSNAAELGIAFVHQEMAMLPTMSIMDTMFITNYPTHNGFINYKETYDRCIKVLRRLGCNFDPKTKIRNISPGSQQLVEIARALLREPRIVIFDEPTSSLTSREKEHLFKVINNLKDEGVVIIYISHLLDEVFEIGDRAVVLRNGKTVGYGCIKDLTYNEIVKMMIGSKQISQYYSHTSKKVGEKVFQVTGLKREGVIDDICFSICSGEVVGLWGLMGSGRTEVARALVGLDPVDGGEILIRHHDKLQAVRFSDTKKWIGMITENRREEGLFLPMSVKYNMSLANLGALITSWIPFIDYKKEIEQSNKYVNRLEIIISNIDQRVETLSGGNQQKVIVGRWLQKNPLIFIMDEPTRGLDVGAKADIRNIINELAESGVAIMVISSEIDEIMSVSDRYLIMNRGRIVAELPREASKQQLMEAAAGGI
jgi:ABC-type sugar transport system ATPase subunit